jgi:DNA modification methylase
LWHDLEAERHAIKKAVPEAVEVYGTMDYDERERRVIGFADGEYRLLATKKEISGQGCNFQRHCHRAIFLGIDYEFNDFIQAIHRIYRFLQTETVIIDIIYTESEAEIKKALLHKWRQYDEMTETMAGIVRDYGLNNKKRFDDMRRTIGVERVEVSGKHYRAVNNDCVAELRDMPDNSVDEIITSIPFGNLFEYSPNYADFGHNEDKEQFFKQMDYLTPNLLRVLKPGRVYCCHVKDRILYGNMTGTGMPTLDAFHADVIHHVLKHGFQIMGMITVVTDVVRENNQTYRLGWTECCKDGSKMGVGCPEYILLFRKLPTDTSKAYADVPVKKSKEEYTRAQWQIDAHGFWRSSGDRLVTKEEMESVPTAQMEKVYRKYSRESVYSYAEHVALAKKLDAEGRLPATFMVVAPGSWNESVRDDINRMRTYNTTQSQRRKQLHVCPLQIDIVDRLIDRYSNEGETILDPFGGIMTVPTEAVKRGRRGIGIELNADYFRDGVGYLESADNRVGAPTLFDFIECGGIAE